ncbi:MAG: hypothetical protein H6Q21_2179 [Bacteroidetes bacterium]|nr:hypothetical protein [Bacteroidota bacterium]
MKKIPVLIILLTILLTTGCEELLKIVSSPSLTTEEVVSGLKKALEIGTDSAVSITSVVNGYYKDKLIKIGLPPEANTIVKYINKVPGGSKMVEDLVKSVNRSAESAAKEAAPIFKNAIRNMTIADGWAILNGKSSSSSSSSAFDSTAATKYLKKQTYKDLVSLYAPKIDKALDRDLGLGFSANTAWTKLTNAYNQALPVIRLVDPNAKSVNTDIGEFCTEKALDGLFLKVQQEEKEIRRDPYKWAVDLINKVFGSVYKK